MFGLPLWLFSRVLPALFLTGIVSYGVHSYNTKVRDKAVDAALIKERAITAPTIKLLGEWVAQRDASIDAMHQSAQRELKRQTEAANAKQQLYNQVVKQNANLSKQLKNSFVDAHDLSRQLQHITARSRATCPSESDYPRRLGDALAQCEADLNQSIRATEDAAAIAANALAAARALKNSD